MTGQIILILGDQLDPALSSLQAGDRTRDVVLMAEVSAETTYVAHHKKKIAFVLAAMRHFAEELRADGWRVDYVRLDDPANIGSLAGEVRRACQRHGLDAVLMTEPSEWRLRQDLSALPGITLLDDSRFIADRQGFATWAEGRKGLRMEHFYRLMRRKTGLLMEGDEPVGGRWNLDAENRGRAEPGTRFMPPLRHPPDAITRGVLDLVGARFADHFGDLEPFWLATTRSGAEAAFEHFVVHALPRFGEVQDAMLQGEAFLCHAVISAYLNVGLLDPLAVCRRAEAEWHAGRVPLNSAEGFIRQIIGWREFVRGIYWWRMPDYVASNALEATRPLPDFYWSGETQMACMKACISQTRTEAYAHHIQRLMVTGNFALLAGIDPHAVHEWYLAVYVDAFEWVELPNTVGMSQFADGGLLASKPYVASGAYINRMSDYCSGCRYQVKAKEGASACPFNLLYWHFVARHADRLGNNPRMAQTVRTWQRFTPARQATLLADAEAFLARLAGPAAV